MDLAKVFLRVTLKRLGFKSHQVFLTLAEAKTSSLLFTLKILLAWSRK